ncbi:ATP-binding protein [Candidatus Roizmanbacteria bacterium]|nr:ATP-binding protein [Candidatus Roizmanbacteria bacterium]
MFIPRFYDQLDKYLKKNKTLIFYGPRQVGKTTLIKNYLKNTKLKYRLDNGENISIQEVLSSQNFDLIKEYCHGYQLIVIDEAQKIPNIGLGLKIIVDNISDVYVIATGSSSFELSGQIGEPLTGRKITQILYPLSQLELSKIQNNFELKNNLPDYLIFGSYPETLTQKGKKTKIAILNELVNSYLLKDILQLEKVKGAKILLDLLRLVAFQVGSEVSYNELAMNLRIDVKTVARYLDLFEKSFILFNLRGYSRNLRTEVVKKSKYYFYDNGIRNAIISNFNPIEKRNDLGALWENFLVIERLKIQSYKKLYSNNYFWRTWDKKEIDWIEEREGSLYVFEFKYKKLRKNNFLDFKSIYPKSQYKTITKDNYLNFIT